MNVNGATILVTGGAGFIGSHLSESLARDGYSVAVLDNLDPFYAAERKRRNLRAVSAAGSVRFYEADIRDADAVKAVFRQEQPRMVVHLAARAGVRPSLLHPELYQQVNVGGTGNLLAAAAAFGVGKFVFASSSSVYGDAASVPFTENETNLRPISPYAATKLEGEGLCRRYAHAHGMPTVCLRLFTVYGPRQRPDLAIHKFVAQIETGEVLTVYGTGETSRDYTYVDDTVKGIRAALDLDAPFAVLNLGNSNPVRLSDLIAALETVCGKPARLRFAGMEQGDVVRTWADISRARRLLDFDPKTPLLDGLERFVAWFRRRDAVPALETSAAAFPSF